MTSGGSSNQDRSVSLPRIANILEMATIILCPARLPKRTAAAHCLGISPAVDLVSRFGVPLYELVPVFDIRHRPPSSLVVADLEGVRRVWYGSER
jgi:hypothetical protein